MSIYARPMKHDFWVEVLSWWVKLNVKVDILSLSLNTKCGARNWPGNVKCLGLKYRFVFEVKVSP